MPPRTPFRRSTLWPLMIETAEHHHRNRLNEDDAAQAIEGGDEQEDQRPGDNNLENSMRLGAASPDRRQKAADEKEPDERSRSFLGHVFEGALGAPDTGTAPTSRGCR